MNTLIKNEGQGQIFNNAFLEYVSKCPPKISAGIYLLVVVSFLGLAFYFSVASLVKAIIWFVGALLFWTLFEYFAHRYLFHLDEHFPKSKLAEKVAYTFHGIHHEYPRDTERIIMPPIPGMLITAVLFGFYYLILGAHALLFMPGFMLGYLIYTRIHYKTHTKPVPSYLKTQYRHHSLHHYKYPEKAFGVSTTFWDRVFGTMPPV
jgi:sterol desaturase/sphingolipid hydroxylase (fatty acid hydroxylase superfamily)